MKIKLTPEQESEITIAYLEDSLKWWSAKRGWTEEEKEFRVEFVPALKAILKCLKP